MYLKWADMRMLIKKKFAIFQGHFEETYVYVMSWELSVRKSISDACVGSELGIREKSSFCWASGMETHSETSRFRESPIICLDFSDKKNSIIFSLYSMIFHAFFGNVQNIHTKMHQYYFDCTHVCFLCDPFIVICGLLLNILRRNYDIFLMLFIGILLGRSFFVYPFQCLRKKEKKS